MSEDILNQLDKVTKKRKDGINGKQKGKRTEGWFADKLSEVSGLHFHRIYTSGASVGQTNSKRLDVLTQGQAESQLGDIQSPEDLKHYLLWESKGYADLDFNNLMSIGSSKKLIGWLEELEYDIESATTRMKDNHRQVAGFLVIKITRKGSWIVGNLDYLVKVFGNIKLNNYLTFEHTTRDSLLKIGFGKNYFMTDFEEFINNNKHIFEVDTERLERLEKAKEAYKKILEG